ncbi:hypothetical protein [Gimibacter soli]|uniref:Uncharacterized protein n=1 Tax=Gimibacter soli TaxID=3024400 RepID=A0AAE9XUX1_9PROT|nr:hypothetical protein [Gimibacter soli]WCL55115.1 hypothetical protein PH603_05005 [Gimibacter soli]
MTEDKDNSMKMPYSALSTPTLKPRFPKAALAYVDATLGILARHHDRAQAVAPFTVTNEAALPGVADILAEADTFFGAGWSVLESDGRGNRHRWMDRMASLMLRLDLSAGARLRITGTGLVRGRCLKEASVWLDGNPVKGAFRRKGLKGWTYDGAIAPTRMPPGAACHLLTIQTDRSGLKGDDTEAGRSLAVSRVEVIAA